MLNQGVPEVKPDCRLPVRQAGQASYEKTGFLLFIAFLEGGTVMAVELAGAQMTAAFFGTSLQVWSSVIGITLLGLTVGYYFGGVVSAKFSKFSSLYFILFLASFSVAVMPITAGYVLTSTLDMNIISGLIFSCFILLFFPLLLLGMISPILIRRISNEVSKAGKSAGTVYAVSTIGGIFSALLLGFYIIPYFGINIGIYASASLLVLLVIWYLIHSKKVIYLVFTLLILCFFIAGINKGNRADHRSSKFNILYKSDGVLGQVKVIDDIRNIRILFMNNIPQTKMHKTGRSLWPYVYRIATYASFKPENSKVLLAGLGGGNLVNELKILGFDVDAVEIDKRMTDIAYQYFNMSKDVKIYIDDFRHFIKTAKKKYDIIIIDLSAGEVIPSNVYTVEAFGELKLLLEEDGVLFVHYLSTLKDDGEVAVMSIGKTMESAGFKVKMLNTSPKIDKVSELVFVASFRELDFSDLTYRIDPEILARLKFPLRENIYLTFVNFNNGLILTDNKPILDVLQQHSTMLLRKENRERILKPMKEDHLNIL